MAQTSMTTTTTTTTIAPTTTTTHSLLPTEFPRLPLSQACGCLVLSARCAQGGSFASPLEKTTCGPHEAGCMPSAAALGAVASPRAVQDTAAEPTPNTMITTTTTPTPTAATRSAGSNAKALIECKHWLEVHDPKHRYGTYLRAYYDAWEASGSTQAFFHWLDEGDGRLQQAKTSPARKLAREVPRDLLDASRVRYCDASESDAYEVRRRDEDGLLVWASETPLAPGAQGRGALVDTTGDDERWIFVIDDRDRLLVNRKAKALFHHSSFVAGKPVRAAGRISVRDGHVVTVSPNSGHYRTTREQLVVAVRDVLGDDIVVAELSADGPSES